MNKELLLVLITKMIEHTNHPTGRPVDINNEQEVMEHVFNPYLRNKEHLDAYKNSITQAEKYIDKVEKELSNTSRELAKYKSFFDLIDGSNGKLRRSDIESFKSKAFDH